MNDCILCGESPHGDTHEHFMIHFIQKHCFILDELANWREVEQFIQLAFIEEDKLE